MLRSNVFAGHPIFVVHPAAEVHQLAALGTKGTERIVFPLSGFTAGWALHERRVIL